VYQTAGNGINAAAMTAVAAEQFVEIYQKCAESPVLQGGDG